MSLLANFFVSLVALFHIYVFILEMFLWTKPFGLKVFRMSLQKAQDSRVLAMNQGLYNGFLAAGLLFGLLFSNLQVAFTFKIFFLLCVIAAGIFGGVTVSKRIFYMQAIPAIIALVLVIITN